MKKKMGIFKKKYIPGALCIAVFIIAFVSAGVNLSAVKNDRGIYYRNDLPGTYISAEETYSYYEEQYSSGEAEENSCLLYTSFTSETDFLTVPGS